MTIRNTLFIMCDQLRRDHLGCYGHPTLRTRNIDALAARGVRFDRAYVTSGVCGPSRMSFYTGRYVSSHGATWNRVPLSVGEVTLGEYLKDSGRALALAGKTHVMPDNANLKRLHLDGGTELETLLRSGHFTEVDRHDGHHAEPRSAYADWLRRQGYDSADPWTDYVISAENARGDDPWVLHLSLVKPHWPYLAPAPYHAAYALDDCLPLQRHQAELEDPHPVLSAYRTQEECANFMRAEVSDTVRPAYQGLIQQIDDRLGLLWEQLERLGRWHDTLIVFTADHGDFLGDHWLGEKEQFYDTVQNIPLIVYDPSPQADATRGSAQDSLVSAVDVVPTVLDALGLPPADHRVEGRSLLDLTRPAARAGAGAWRDAVVSELDYAYRGARVALGRHPGECRAWMVRDARWKYVHWQGFRPQLFDLHNDPQEYFDLGADPAHEAVRSAMRLRLLDWFCTLKPRVTVTNDEVAAKTNVYKQAGVFFGVW